MVKQRTNEKQEVSAKIEDIEKTNGNFRTEKYNKQNKQLNG